MGSARLVVTHNQGRTGGTWAHWQIALAYAKYLSNEFHRFVNEASREWAEEQADPDLKARRAVAGYRRRGKDDRWILGHLEWIVRRHRLADTLKEHGAEGVGYARCTDAINRGVLGGTARKIKLARAGRAGFAAARAVCHVQDGYLHGHGLRYAILRDAGEIRPAMREARGFGLHSPVRRGGAPRRARAGRPGRERQAPTRGRRDRAA